VKARFGSGKVAQSRPPRGGGGGEGENLEAGLLSAPENLTVETAFKLRTLLPQFDIRLGRSNVSRDNPVDVLIVDRDKISEADIINVLRTLKDVQIPIKSVQQAHFPQPKIQVGTILYRSSATAPFTATFATTPPLDIEKLASLSGDEFWKAALNGQAWCPEKGGAVRCSISPDGRAVEDAKSHS
jgi:hypothetical protein